MQMLNQHKVNNRFKKSHALIIGSLLIFSGIVSLSWNYLLMMKDQVYSDMKIAMMDDYVDVPQQDISVNENPIDNTIVVNNYEEPQEYEVNYDKYLGVLEIPKIGLKRGFYGLDSKYNSIQYNVTLVNGSTMPDVDKGNLILMAHSGDAYISYFAYLYKLNIGDDAYVTYAGNKYHYQIVNIYEVPKIGIVSMSRNKEKTTLTMITCTKDNDYSQTVYISELVG